MEAVEDPDVTEVFGEKEDLDVKDAVIGEQDVNFLTIVYNVKQPTKATTATKTTTATATATTATETKYEEGEKKEKG